MNGYKLIQIMGGGSSNWSNPLNPHAHLPRYAAMCGFFEIPAMHPHDYQIYGIGDIEVPDEIVPKILALHFAERASNDLRAMGEGMGRMQVNVPSNINVWSHSRGEAQLITAAKALTEAVSKLA